MLEVQTTTQRSHIVGALAIFEERMFPWKTKIGLMKVTIFDDPLAPLNTKVSPWPGRLFQWPRRTRSKYLPLLGRGCHSPRPFLMLPRRVAENPGSEYGSRAL